MKWNCKRFKICHILGIQNPTYSVFFSFFIKCYLLIYLFSSWMIEWSYWSIVDHGSIIFFTVQNSILFLELVLHITFTFLPFNIFSCVTLHQHFQQYFYLMILIYNIQKYLKEGTLYLLSSEMHYYWLCNKYVYGRLLVALRKMCSLDFWRNFHVNAAKARFTSTVYVQNFNKQVLY